jgi:hypothetical protein
MACFDRERARRSVETLDEGPDERRRGSRRDGARCHYHHNEDGARKTSVVDGHPQLTRHAVPLTCAWGVGTLAKWCAARDGLAFVKGRGES